MKNSAGHFLACDELRPPTIETYDMRAIPSRVDNVLLGRVNLSTNDLGADSDNDWTRRRRRRCPHLRGLHLRLLLQAIRPPGPQQRRHPRCRTWCTRCTGRTSRSLRRRFRRLLRQRVLRRRRCDGVRRRAAAGLHARRADVGLPRRRPRHRRPRAHARRHRIHVEPDLPKRVGRAERSRSPT